MRRALLVVHGKDLERLIEPEQLGRWLNQRRIELVGKRMIDLAQALGVTKAQASELCAGRIPFGPKQIGRINKIDPTFELLPVFALVRREPQDGDGDL